VHSNVEACDYLAVLGGGREPDGTLTELSVQRLDTAIELFHRGGGRSDCCHDPLSDDQERQNFVVVHDYLGVSRPDRAAAAQMQATVRPDVNYPALVCRMAVRAVCSIPWSPIIERDDGRLVAPEDQAHCRTAWPVTRVEPEAAVPYIFICCTTRTPGSRSR
jgi:hypothetical protein